LARKHGFLTDIHEDEKFGVQQCLDGAVEPAQRHMSPDNPHYILQNNNLCEGSTKCVDYDFAGGAISMTYLLGQSLAGETCSNIARGCAAESAPLASLKVG
jgi:hypothetical protein